MVRRAEAARSLLAAAGALALIATLLLTGLVAYSRQVVAAGVAGTVAAAAPGESSVLAGGSAGTGAADLDRRDAAVRARFTAGLGGRPVGVYAAGYSAGRQLTGRTGDAVPDSGGVVYGSVVFLQDLPRHATLSAGSWPRPGARPVQTAVGEGAARVLGLEPGDRVPVTDRLTGKASALVVSGIWRPVDDRDAYWRLAPDVSAGVAAGTATYGPLVVDRADFVRDFARSASASWLADVDLSGAGVADLRRVADAADAQRRSLPGATGLGTSGYVDSGLSGLADQLSRADLVGRSALVTPVLLVSVLSGLALVLVAVLLTEHRRAESALLRARGATAWQLAGLSAAEAVAVALPAALLAPPLAAAAVHLAGERGWFGLGQPGSWWPGPGLWLVALAAAAGCAIAITAPVLRGGTYVEDLMARSRPNRRAVVQRAGADLLLVAVAVLGWLQLRQYSSPLAAGVSGGLGIDPLLAAAPTLGILAGATLALRLLMPAARAAERVLGGRRRFAALFGMWQAGRRPHAGPVLLLALAVAAGTVGWCLAATAQRSQIDQAGHDVGADLRVVEQSGAAPAGRAEALAALPGVTRVLPGWREGITGAEQGSADLIAVDAAAAGDAVRVRSDLYDGGPRALATALTGARTTAPVLALPAGRRLTGRFSITGALAFDGDGAPTLTAVLTDPAGTLTRVPLIGGGTFSAELPAPDGGPLRLAGFIAGVDTFSFDPLQLTVSRLAVDGRPVTLDDRWSVASRQQAAPAKVQGGTLTAEVDGYGAGRTQFAVVRTVQGRPVPVVATPAARDQLHLSPGGQTKLHLGGGDVPVRLTGTIAAVPGSANAAALLVDLPSLRSALFYQAGLVHDTQEWWLAVPADRHDEAAAGARRLPGLTVLDRRSIAAASATDAYGVGGRTALFVAAIGALILAAAGILVDVRTTARRRIGELAVLHTLGAGPRLLARSLMTEQAFLAGTGVLAGLAVGVGVAATMAPLVVLTPQATRPVPEPLLVVDWWRAGGTALLLFALAVGLSAVTGSALRRRLATARLHLGADK
ncbi:hypothetical protein L083_4495 [Actinoplanes sp. N902-109]|nr:hypothetical protein L083_4495 [Actinoplanes sp. N902-109]